MMELVKREVYMIKGAPGGASSVTYDGYLADDKGNPIIIKFVSA